MGPIKKRGRYDEFKALCIDYQNNIADFGYGVEVQGKDFYLVNLSTNEKYKAYLDRSHTKGLLGLISQVGSEKMAIYFSEEYLSIFLGKDSEEAPYQKQELKDKNFNIARSQLINDYECRSSIMLTPNSINLKLTIINKQGVEYCRNLMVNFKEKQIEYQNNIHSEQAQDLSGISKIVSSTFPNYSSLCTISRKRGGEYLSTPMSIPRIFILTANSFDEVICSFCNTEEIRKFLEFLLDDLIAVLPTLNGLFKFTINNFQQPQYQNSRITKTMTEAVTALMPDGMISMDSILPSKTVKPNNPLVDNQ